MSQEILNTIFEKYGPLMGQANILAELAVPVEMTVWNGKHPVDENKSHHIAGKGSRVLIWMHSRFGDFGITDNLIDPCGYDARVDLSLLKNIVDAGHRPYVEPYTDKKKMYFITVKQAWSNVVVMNRVAVQTKDLNEALTEAQLDARRSLAQEISATLKTRGHWVPDDCMSADLISAVGQAVPNIKKPHQPLNTMMI